MTVIGVDAHKRTHTLVAVDDVGAKLGEKTIAATRSGHAAGLQWARSKFSPELTWGVEDLRSMTSLLERQLLAAKATVVRVSPHLMARNRGSKRAWGKSDAIDAIAVARAVLRDPALPRAVHDDISWELRMLVDRREDVVGQRVKTINGSTRFTREHNLLRSVGRTAVCWDNAQQESIWATLKVEFYHRHLWPTKATARVAVGDWIERIYNRRRRHSSLSMICPVEFETQLTQTAHAA